jgi:hypothetical protein
MDVALFRPRRQVVAASMRRECAAHGVTMPKGRGASIFPGMTHSSVE